MKRVRRYSYLTLVGQRRALNTRSLGNQKRRRIVDAALRFKA